MKDKFNPEQKKRLMELAGIPLEEYDWEDHEYPETGPGGPNGSGDPVAGNTEVSRWGRAGQKGDRYKFLTTGIEGQDWMASQEMKGEPVRVTINGIEKKIPSEAVDVYKTLSKEGRREWRKQWGFEQ